jgi:hypothetical protein
MARVNKEKAREYQRKYRAANRDKLLERDREYARRRRAASPEVREKARIAAKKWYALNKAKALKAQKLRYAANPGRNRQYSDEWKIKNREKAKASSRKCKSAWLPTRYDEYLAKQHGLCAICGSSMKRPNADHDHETGQPRELLCTKCNIGLAHVEQAAWLEAALAYVEKWKLRPDQTAVVDDTSA